MSPFVSVVIFLLGTSSVCLGVQIPGVTTTEDFKQYDVLDTDGNYILFWKFNDTHITFEVHVQTKGWVGFGLSGNGNMFPGDVVVGWVSNGTVHFADRHTVAHRMPLKDTSQDWHLLHWEENDFGTVLKFVRQLDTCDSSEDMVIQEGTNRVIFAYGTDDPADDDSIMYHGTTRGTKSIYFLSPSLAVDTLPKDVKYFDFLQNNYLVPSNKTTYWCRGFKMPPIGKHHMIKYEPVITPGNELNVHHILIYQCRVDNPDYWHGKTSHCYEKSRTLPQCYDIVIAWAIGGKPFYFPDHVGYSIGGPEDESFYVMEMHYDNPTQKAHMVDNSGIRIALTPTLRPHEGGLIEMGHNVDFEQIIPPGLTNFVSKSYCSDQCISDGLSQSNLNEIKVFAALQHSHLLGVGIKTRHFRNGTEIKPLIQDPNYDFDFQETRPLPREISVYPGDSFQVDCTYDSTKRTEVTFGGLSTKDEMCLTFIYYYPRITLVDCISRPTLDSFPFSKHDAYFAMVNADWTNQTVVDDFMARIHNSSVEQMCYGPKYKTRWPFPIYKPQETAMPYVPPPPQCT